MCWAVHFSDGGGHTSPVAFVEFIQHDEGGGETLPIMSVWLHQCDEEMTPPLSRLWSSFNMMRGGNPPCLVCLTSSMRRGGKPSLSCLSNVLRCNKARNTKSVPTWAYSWCSCPLHLSRHVKCAQTGTFYMSGVVSNAEHQKHARLDIFLCSALSLSTLPSVNTTPPSLNTRDRGVLVN